MCSKGYWQTSIPSNVQRLPKITTDLEVKWNWSYGASSEKPVVNFKNITVDARSILNDILKPVAQRIANFLKPLEPVIDLLTTKLDTTVDDKVLTVKTTNETNEEIIDAVEEVGFFANKIEE